MKSINPCDALVHDAWRNVEPGRYPQPERLPFYCEALPAFIETPLKP